MHSRARADGGRHRRHRHRQPARDDRPRDRETGEPIAPAIVRQDPSHGGPCATVSRRRAARALLRERSGLLIDPYFSPPRSAGCWTTSPARGAGQSAGRSLSARWTPSCSGSSPAVPCMPRMRPTPPGRCCSTFTPASGGLRGPAAPVPDPRRHPARGARHRRRVRHRRRDLARARGAGAGHVGDQQASLVGRPVSRRGWRRRPAAPAPSCCSTRAMPGRARAIAF